jgi:hypothetical protein
VNEVDNGGNCDSSVMTCLIHMRWAEAYEHAMYSASQVDLATQDCLFEDHETVASLTCMMYPLKLLKLSRSDPQDASEYIVAVDLASSFRLNRRTYEDVC